MAITKDGQLKGWPCSLDIYPAGGQAFELVVFLFTDDADNEAPADIQKLRGQLQMTYPTEKKMKEALAEAGFVEVKPEPVAVKAGVQTGPGPKQQAAAAILSDFIAEETEDEPKRRYEGVNGQWPDDIPDLTDAEAISAVKRLYRVAMKKPLRIKLKIGTGNRITWPHQGVYIVNATKGWHDLVHMVSHYCHRRLFPKKKPHDGTGTHAFLEKELIAHVVKSGWLDGKLKPKAATKPRPTKTEKQADKLASILDRIKRWEQKERRAQTALAKLAKQRRYYKRALA